MSGMKFLQESCHFLVPHAGTAWICWLTLLFAFRFRCFGFRSRQSIPNFARELVSHVVPFYHAVTVTSHMDVMKACIPLIKEFDGVLIDFSKCLLLLHSHILAHAEADG